MIAISSHRPDGRTIPGVLEFPNEASANHSAKEAAAKNRGFIYIVWVNGFPTNSWSFTREVATA